MQRSGSTGTVSLSCLMRSRRSSWQRTRVGMKYVDQQVYRALRSPDYKSILAKIGKMDPYTMSFKKSDVASGLTESEKKKLNNFLQKMKSLNVLRSGDVQGEYIFNVRMVRLYIWLQSLEEKNRRAGK